MVIGIDASNIRTGGGKKHLEKFINKFNSKTIRIFNKITFKNFVNNFFKSYSG